MAESKKNSARDDQSVVSFEAAMEQLEQIVARLEEGQAGLSDSLAAYEQGVKLLRQCHELLAQAERKIEVLAGFDPEGNPVTEPLDQAEGESLEEKATARTKRRSRSSPSQPSPSESSTSSRRQPRPLSNDEIDSEDIPF